MSVESAVSDVINNVFENVTIMSIKISCTETMLKLPNSRIFLLFNFRFGQEVNVKLGSPLCKYFLTINDLYNGAKIVVVEI